MDAQRMENHRLAMERLQTYMTTSKFWEGASAVDRQRIRNQSKRHKIKDGVLIYVSVNGEEKEVITSLERVADIIEKYHSSPWAGGHSGIEATVEKISSFYRWGSVKNDVTYYIKRCPFCQTQRSSMSLSPRDDEELPRKKSKLQPTEVSNTKKRSSSTVLSARSSASSQSNVQPVKPNAGHRIPVTPSAQANVSLASTRFALPSKKTGVGKKLPACGLSGRLKDMEYMLSQQEARISSLQSQLETHNKRVAHLEQQKEQLSGDVAQRDKLSQVVDKENAERQRQRDFQEEMDTLHSKHQREIEDLTFSKLYLERQYATLEEELKASRTEVSTLNSSVAHLTSSRASVDAELAATKLSLEQAFRKIQAHKEVIQQLRLELAGRDAIIDENNRKIREHEKQTIQHHSETKEGFNNLFNLQFI
ncbi:uncharacterized protein LOC112554993 isoform X3 [Pomacea canaliculata]|uniref:uncharacterized protein LOC112554993 isoform X3 n=1 Tax=Pomacea canaliculata TaxID=400727 RepID=UPI000D730756|nr:uncharacterized protein LOC112554993 isoform X3 [Pomacea canaliculata]